MDDGNPPAKQAAWPVESSGMRALYVLKHMKCEEKDASQLKGRKKQRGCMEVRNQWREIPHEAEDEGEKEKNKKRGSVELIECC